jgi:hypothetical protein
MTNIGSQNVGRIAERIVANELEARGFRVSDLNKDGVAANADLLAVSPDRTPLQIQVKGAANDPKEPFWFGYGFCTEQILAGSEPMFNRRKGFYAADIVVLAAVRSPTEYSCVILPIDVAERAAQLHLDAGYRKGRRDGQPRKPHKTAIVLEPSPRAKTTTARYVDERALLAPYQDELGWARLLQSN